MSVSIVIYEAQAFAHHRHGEANRLPVTESDHGAPACTAEGGLGWALFNILRFLLRVTWKSSTASTRPRGRRLPRVTPSGILRATGNIRRRFASGSWT